MGTPVARMSLMLKPLRVAHGWRAAILLASGFACALVPAVANASSVNLAAASPFVVLGASTVTNTGPSVLNGSLGLSPGTSIVGFGPPAVVNGGTHAADALAGIAQNDLTTAYGVAAGQPIPLGNDLTGQDLGGLTLTPGAYMFSSSAQLTGRLTLNALGNPQAQFVFEIGSTLTTASASSVSMINGASPCNVYWQIGSSATLGTTTAFQGNLLAHTSITLNTGATVLGRALAGIGAVTLDDNVIDASACGTTPTSSPPGTVSLSGTASTFGTGSLSGTAASSGTGSSTGASAPATPVVGQSVTLRPASGTVQVQLPGAHKFVALQTASSIPVGTVIDTTHGKVRLTSAVNRAGETKTGIFTGSRFVVGQADVGLPLTKLRLVGGSFAACSGTGAVTDAMVSGREPDAAPPSHKVVRQLWGHDNNGKFVTIGRSASAAVRGTIWLTQDRCDGTLIRVFRGRVLVHATSRRHAVLLGPGQSYFARARR
jgi:Ice-binding-like